MDDLAVEVCGENGVLYKVNSHLSTANFTILMIRFFCLNILFSNYVVFNRIFRLNVCKMLTLLGRSTRRRTPYLLTGRDFCHVHFYNNCVCIVVYAQLKIYILVWHQVVLKNAAYLNSPNLSLEPGYGGSRSGYCSSS